MLGSAGSSRTEGVQEMNPNLSGYRRFYFTALDYFASLPFQVRAGSIQLSFGPGESLTTGLGMSRKKRGGQGLVVAGFWWSERRSWEAKASPTQGGVLLRDCHVAALLAMTNVMRDCHVAALLAMTNVMMSWWNQKIDKKGRKHIILQVTSQV